MSDIRDRAQRVFVVYGRNRDAHNALTGLLASIGLEVVDWEAAVVRTGKPAPHAREVIEAAMAAVGAVVILMSGDEEARLRKEFCAEHEFETEGMLAPQARPNVLFEAGLAFALYPERTVLVQLGRLRPLSDLAGVQYVPLDSSPQTHRALLNRLRLAGCRVRPLPAGPRPGGLPSPDEGLPPAPTEDNANSGSVALLRRLRSLFSVAAMGGSLEVIESAEVGDRLILSLRLPVPAGAPLALRHWVPGSSNPLHLSIPLTSSNAGVVDMPFEILGPAGIHYFDLVESGTNQNDKLISRTSCAVSET